MSNSVATSELERIRSLLDVEVTARLNVERTLSIWYFVLCALDYFVLFQLILVNETLLRMIQKSGRYREFEEKLKAQEKPPYEIVAFTVG